MNAQRTTSTAFTWGVPMACMLLVLACSDGSSKQDASPGQDGPVTSQDGPVTGQDGPVTGQDSKVTGDTTCDPTFGKAQACGGDLEGKWTYIKGCTPKDIFDGITKICPGAKVSNEATSTAGTLTFTKATYAMDASVIVSSDFTLTAGCAAIAGGCAKAGSAIQLVVKSSKVSCTQASSGCDCKITLTYATKWAGIYTVSGSEVTLKTGQQYHYCVKDNVLRYRGDSANLTDNSATYVLTR